MNCSRFDPARGAPDLSLLAVTRRTPHPLEGWWCGNPRTAQARRDTPEPRARSCQPSYRDLRQGRRGRRSRARRRLTIEKPAIRTPPRPGRHPPQNSVSKVAVCHMSRRAYRSRNGNCVCSSPSWRYVSRRCAVRCCRCHASPLLLVHPFLAHRSRLSLAKPEEAMAVPVRSRHRLGDVSTARCIRDRSLFPVPRPKSPSDLRLARRPESARPALEPNLFRFACSRLSAAVRPIKSNSTESEADPKMRLAALLDRCSLQSTPSCARLLGLTRSTLYW